MGGGGLLWGMFPRVVAALGGDRWGGRLGESSLGLGWDSVGSALEVSGDSFESSSESDSASRSAIAAWRRAISDSRHGVGVGAKLHRWAHRITAWAVGRTVKVMSFKVGWWEGENTSLY